MSQCKCIAGLLLKPALLPVWRSAFSENLLPPNRLRTLIHPIPFSQLRKLVDENASKNIMIIVKGPAEALQLAKELPEVTEINYGGVAKKAGSKEYGKAVYLNEAELKATQELISMGKKIYIQMVPSSPIEHASFEN